MEKLSAVQEGTLKAMPERWASAAELGAGVHTLRALARAGLIECKEPPGAWAAPRMLITWRKKRRKEAK